MTNLNNTTTNTARQVNVAIEIVNLATDRAIWVNKHGSAKGFYGEMYARYREMVNSTLNHGIAVSKKNKFCLKLAEALPAACQVAESLSMVVAQHAIRVGLTLGGVDVTLPVYDPNRPSDEGRRYESIDTNTATELATDEHYAKSFLGRFDLELIEHYAETWKRDWIDAGIKRLIPAYILDYTDTLLGSDDSPVSADLAPAWKCISAIVKEWSYCLQKTNYNSPSARKATKLSHQASGYNDYQKRFDAVSEGGETERSEEDKAYLAWYKLIESRFDAADRMVKDSEFIKVWNLCLQTTDMEYGGRSLFPTFKIREDNENTLKTYAELLPDYEHFVYSRKEIVAEAGMATGKTVETVVYQDLRKVFMTFEDAVKKFPVESVAVNAAYIKVMEAALGEHATTDAKTFEKFEAVSLPDTGASEADILNLLR